MTNLNNETPEVAPEADSQRPKAPKKATAAKQRPDVATKKAKAGTKPTPAKKAAQAAKPRKAAKARKNATEPAGKKTASVARPDSKGATILQLIGRAKGATLAEIMKATGWQAHSVRGFLSTAGKKRGLKIESVKNDEGARIYTIKT